MELFGVCVLCTKLFLAILLMNFWIFWRVNQSTTDLHYICKLYGEGSVVGGVCDDVCDDIDDIIDTTAKESLKYPMNVFSYRRHGKLLVLKSLYQASKTFKMFSSSNVTDRHLQWLVEDLLRRENLVIAESDHSLSVPTSRNSFNEATSLSKGELHTLWYLLQQPEFVKFLPKTGFIDIAPNVGILAGKSTDTALSGYYPRIFGVCGSYYAVEHPRLLSSIVKTISDTTTPNKTDNKRDWLKVAEISNKILQLANALDSTPRNKSAMHGCGISLDTIGITENLNIKITNSARVINSLVLDMIQSDKSCKIDADCHFQNCHFSCDIATQRCQRVRRNAHLQMLCHSLLLPMYRHAPLHLKSCITKLTDACKVGNEEGTKVHLQTLIEHLKHLIAEH